MKITTCFDVLLAQRTNSAKYLQLPAASLHSMIMRSVRRQCGRVVRAPAGLEIRRWRV